MKTTLIGIAYGAVLLIGWKIQEFDLLLGHTIGVFGLLIVTFFLVNHLADKIKL